MEPRFRHSDEPGSHPDVSRETPESVPCTAKPSLSIEAASDVLHCRATERKAHRGVIIINWVNIQCAIAGVISAKCDRRTGLARPKPRVQNVSSIHRASSGVRHSHKRCCPVRRGAVLGSRAKRGVSPPRHVASRQGTCRVQGTQPRGPCVLKKPHPWGFT
ncbi:uncharacterized protein conserved in bacteria [Microbacterium testaceum StLB037]|uniref:Uncharacterized protein conserved in bacteria n=1 Tax=Microbacterium testaceum (strain StLB037) TaxID=979556 RepID=E8N943_MICTS|nr:uncharacterized protein conserved in bacteria [Microbacterium testaceum StLB037]